MRRLLLAGHMLGHSMLSGELALGSMKNRAQVLREIDGLPEAIAATDDEVRRFIESKRLYGRGVGYIDAHLLVSVRLTPGTLLWDAGQAAARGGIGAGAGVSGDAAELKCSRWKPLGQ